MTVEKLKWTIDHGERALRAERRPTNFLMMYKRNEVRWEPLGVVAACVSWKYVDIALERSYTKSLTLHQLPIPQLHFALHLNPFHRLCPHPQGLRKHGMEHTAFRTHRQNRPTGMWSLSGFDPTNCLLARNRQPLDLPSLHLPHHIHRLSTNSPSRRCIRM